MITDEERREVAARMRNQLTYMRENGKYYKNDLDVVECGNRTYRNIAASVENRGNAYEGNYIHIVETLADLIDRPTCHNVADYTKESFRCSECGCRVLVPGDEPDGVLVVTSEAFPLDWYSCPVCGAVVLDD